MSIAKPSLLVLAGLMLAAAEPPGNDPDAIKGIWAVESATFNGLKIPYDPTAGAQMTAFDGTEYVQRQGAKILEEGVYEVDATKTPKAIDFVHKKGADAGKRQLGIYEVDGHILRVCLVEPGTKVRPKSFDAGVGTNHLLVVSKRYRP